MTEKISGSLSSISGKPRQPRLSALALFRFILFILFASQGAYSSAAVVIDFRQTVKVCSGNNNVQWPVDFNNINCSSMPLMDVNPQGQELWVEVMLELSEAQHSELAPPLALFLFAKASSEAYLNGKWLGASGRPGNAVNEVPGLMDSYFYIPEGLLSVGDNEIVLHLSAQKSLLNLAGPLHLLSIGSYSPPQQYVQQYSEL